MRLVERHLIKSTKPSYKELEKLSFLSKNVYNSATYICRQAFFSGEVVPSFNQLYHQLKNGIDYKSLPAKVSQLVIKQVARSFKSFFAAMAAYKQDKSKFLGKPRLPNYKHKTYGRNLICYNYQAISKKLLKQGYINPSLTNIKIKTKQTSICEVRIIPKNGCYLIEVVYEKDCIKDSGSILDKRVAGIDIGISNLATVTSNLKELSPFIVCGKAIKSTNQYFNKYKAKLQSLLPLGKYKSRRIDRLTIKRNNKVDYYLHTASRFIVNQLVSHQITDLIIGKNDHWKQLVNLGAKTNQSFTSIPHAKFIEQLIYKCQLVGIKVHTVNESYTSKCSFLDLEPIKKHETYLGKRVHRGLFKSSSGKTYNCDINGSLNCIRKVVGDSLFKGKLIERLVVSPVRMKPYKAKS
ncbi:RNA-guided endonuclease InsQ/TnpB family protein [Calothrix sp. CCY 0018]|uniref:RNA-guided endonuclease InsQ/TnpB family protein n=1 Tax=Calothrix sp. CCY 0018 TaxID=3103864 RepID=UPI0039C6A3FE